MKEADRRFLLGVVLASLIVPGGLLAWSPFDEARPEIGVLAGWGVALLIMVPSYWLLSRAVGSGDTRKLLRSLLGGSLGRMLLMCASIVVFHTSMQDPPLKSFLLAFGLGYALFTALELTLTLRQRAV